MRTAVTNSEHRVIRAVINCRTAALGGHREWCPQCGYDRYRYHSCRNRHCPKCQTLAKAAWLEERQQELLPAPYLHNVFTLPHELNRLILASERNRRALLDLLFQAAAKTLLAFGENNLGGKVGFTMVLHTWDQQLRPHFHVHCVIAAGALADDGSKWNPASKKFMLKKRQLMLRGRHPASELTKIRVLEGRTWNHPVLVGNRLYVRNAEEAACFEMPVVENREI